MAELSNVPFQFDINNTLRHVIDVTPEEKTPSIQEYSEPTTVNNAKLQTSGSAASQLPDVNPPHVLSNPSTNQALSVKAVSATQPALRAEANLTSKAAEPSTQVKDKDQETTLETIQNEIVTTRTNIVNSISTVKTAIDNLKGHLGQGSQSATQVNYADWSKPAASNTHEQIGSAIEIDKRVTQLVQSGKFDEKQANQIRQHAADLATHYGKSSTEVLDLMVNALNGGLTLDKENAADTLVKHTQFSLQYDRASDQLTADQSSNNLLELYLKTDFGQNLSADEKVSKAAEYSNVIHHVRREQQVNEQSLINLITQNSSRVVSDSFNKEELAAFAGTLLSKNASEAMASTTLKSIHSTLTAGKALDDTKQNAFSQLGFEEMPTQMDQATLVKVFEAIALQDKDAQDDYLEKLFGKESVEVLLPILSDPNGIKAGFGHIADSSKYQGNIEQKSANAADDPYQRINSALTAVNELGNTIGTALLPPIAALADGIVWLTSAIRTSVEQFRTALGGGAVAGVIVAATTWYAASRALKAGTRVLGKLPGKLLDKITSPIKTVLGLKNNGQAGSGLSLVSTNKEIRYATIALKRFSRQLDRATLSAGGSLPDYSSSDNQKNKKGDKGSQGSKKTSATKNSFGKMAINHAKTGGKFAFWTGLISTVLFNANNANAAEQPSSLPSDTTDTADSSNDPLSSGATVSTKTSTAETSTETSEKTADSHTSNLTTLSEENATHSTTENSSSVTDWLMPIGGLAATFIRPLNTVMNTVQLAKAVATGDKENVATLAGDVAGGAAGTAIGATIGTFLLPGIGTAVGGLLGGALGSIAGSKSASWISSKASSFFSSENSEEKLKASQKSQIRYEEQQVSGKAFESTNQSKSGKRSWLRRSLGALDIATLPIAGMLFSSSEKVEQGKSEQGLFSGLFSDSDNETGAALNQADQQVKQELKQTSTQANPQTHSQNTVQNSAQQNQQITITPYITINAAPGSNEELIAENVIQKLGQSIQQSFSSYQSNLDGRLDNNIGLTA